MFGPKILANHPGHYQPPARKRKGLDQKSRGGEMEQMSVCLNIYYQGVNEGIERLALVPPVAYRFLQLKNVETPSFT